MAGFPSFPRLSRGIKAEPWKGPLNFYDLVLASRICYAILRKREKEKNLSGRFKYMGDRTSAEDEGRVRIIPSAARYGRRGVGVARSVLFARQIQRGDSTKDPGFPGKSGECSVRRQLRRIRALSRPSAPFFMFICSGHAGPDSPTRTTTPVINSCRPTRVFN